MPQAGVAKWGAIAAPQPEKLMVYQMLPMAVRSLLSLMAGGSSQNKQAAVQQWADCGIVVRRPPLPVQAACPPSFPRCSLPSLH